MPECQDVVDPLLIVWHIGAGASKFLGVQRIFAQIFPNLPKKLSCNFCRPFLWRDQGRFQADLTDFFSSGPTPKGARRSVHLPKQTYTFYGRCLCTMPARSPVFFKLLWETNIVLTCFQRSLKIQYKFALLPPSKYSKSLLYNHLGIQMKQLRSLKMSLRSARSSLKKTLDGPTVFCKRGIHCQRKSKWTARFLTPSSWFYHKNVRCLQLRVDEFFSLAPQSLRQKGLKFWSCFLFHL